MDDIKQFAKTEKTLIQTIKIYSQDIEIEFGFKKCVILKMKIEKKERNRRTERSNKKKHQNATRERKLQAKESEKLVKYLYVVTELKKL